MITEREKTLEDLINDALDTGDEEAFMDLSSFLNEMQELTGMGVVE